MLPASNQDQNLGHPQTTLGTSNLPSMSTFRNNHNPTSSSPFQDLFYFQFLSVRLIQGIQPMSLPCITYQISANHLYTITHCSLWVARGQDQQKILARAGQTHCPSATKDQLYLHDSTINYISDAHGSAGNLAEPREVASPQNLDCCHFSEGLQHFPRAFCFSKCLKCVAHGKTLALVLLLHLHAPGCLLTFSAKLRVGPHPVSSSILQSTLGLNLSIDLLTPYLGQNFI